jgi:hypothetical protein
MHPSEIFTIHNRVKQAGFSLDEWCSLGLTRWEDFPYIDDTVTGLVHFYSDVSILWTTLGALFCFAASFSCINMSRHLSMAARFGLALTLGPSVYSVVQPPHVEPYSATLFDPENGLTRCFHVTVLSLLYEIAFANGYHVLKVVSLWGLYLLPIWVLVGFIGPPSHVTWWFIEGVFRYAAGKCGALWHDLHCYILVVLYGLAVVWMYLNDSECSAVFLFGICAVLLNVKIWEYRQQWPVAILQFVVHCFSAGIGCLLGSYPEYVELVCVFLCLAFEVVIPLFCANDFVLLALVLPVKQHRRWDWIRTVNSLIVPGLVVGSLWRSTHLPFYARPLLIFHALHGASPPGHIFAFGLVLARGLLEYDFNWCEDRGLKFLIGMCVAHKFASILTDLDHRWRFKMGLLSRGWSSDACVPLCIGSLPALFWQLLTGSPSWYPFYLKGIRFPSSPRPACFWGRPRRRAVSRRGSPQAPAYAALKRWLEKNLMRLIRECAFGWISEGSFLVFADRYEDVDYLAFCHIIAISNTSVFFQLRGADDGDYRMGEFGRLLDYDDDRGNCSAACFLLSLRSAYRACGAMPIRVPVFTSTMTPFTELLDLDAETRTFWMFAAYCRVVSMAGTPNVPDAPLDCDRRPAAFTPECADI